MPSKTQSILLGAVVTAVLSLVQIFVATQGGTAGQYLSTVFCCLVAIAGAGTAVWHYATTHRLTLPAGTGAGLGAGATAIGSLISFALSRALQAVGVFPSDAETLEQARQQLADQGMDPAMIDSSMQMAESMSGVVGGVINLVVLAVLGAIVGAVAASVFKRGEAEDYEV